jgi:hypothetical protein
MKKYLLAIVLVLLTVTSARAQTPCPNPCVMTVGQVYTLQADHDGVDTTGYRVYLDGLKTGADLSMNALTSGVVTVSSLIAPARGAHTIQLAAFNEDNEAKSDPLSFTTKRKAPGKPGGTRIVITAQLVNGEIKVQMVEVLADTIQ